MKKFFADFKKFISRGNIVDMAVGVIIGSAFSTIVKSLTDKIIMPLINALLSSGGNNGLENAYTFLKTVKDETGAVDLSKSIYIDWGAFITAIINFFLIAMVLFIILRIMTRANKFIQEAVDEIASDDKRAVRKALRKQAKAEKRPYKVVMLEYEAEQKRIAEEKAKQAELEKAQKEAEYKLNNPSQEELLKQIRDLLQEKNEK